MIFVFFLFAGVLGVELAKLFADGPERDLVHFNEHLPELESAEFSVFWHLASPLPLSGNQIIAQGLSF